MIRSNKNQIIYVSLLIILSLLLPFFLNDYLVGILITILLFAYWGTSWNLIAGMGGQLSLGHAAFIGIGAYTSTILFKLYDITPWIGMWIGALIATLVSLLVGYLSFRYKLKGLFLALVTLAFGQIIYDIVASINALGGGSGIIIPISNSATNFQFKSKLPYYFIILGFYVVSLLLYIRIKKIKTGYYLQAIRENENAAAAAGVPILKYKMIAFSISAFLSALGGTFYAQYYLFIDPPSILSWSLIISILVPVLVGGLGSSWGPLIGALLIIPFSLLFKIWFGNVVGLDRIVYGIIIIVVVMFLPGGIVSFFKNSTITYRWKKISNKLETESEDSNKKEVFHLGDS